MEFFSLIILVGIVLLIMATFFLLKKLLRFAILAALIIVILSVFAGHSIIKDFTQLKVQDEKTIIIFHSDGKILHAFRQGEILDPAVADQQLQKQDFGAEKAIAYDIDGFADIAEFTINNKQITGASVFEFYKNGQPISSIVLEDLLVDKDIPRSLNFSQALAYYLYLHDLALSRSPLLLLEQYKKGNIGIYPNSQVLDFAKRMPLSLIRGKMLSLQEMVEKKWES